MESKKEVLLKLLHSGMTKQELKNKLKKNNIMEIKVVMKNISENNLSIDGRNISQEEFEMMKKENSDSSVFPVVYFNSEAPKIAYSEAEIY